MSERELITSTILAVMFCLIALDGPAKWLRPPMPETKQPKEINTKSNKIPDETPNQRNQKVSLAILV